MARILVVDDDPDVVEACKLVLEAQDHEVLEANNKADGHKLATDQKPDLIVLDVMMDEPDDGISLAQQLRREGKNMPILMLTSVSKVTGLDIGQDDSVVPVQAFIEKPVEPADLVEQVQQLLTA